MCSSESAFHELPSAPLRADGSALIVRLVEGVGFRLRWASEGLDEVDGEIRPSAEQMSLRELLAHVRDLLAWSAEAAEAALHGRTCAPYAVGSSGDLAELRRQALDGALRARAAFAQMDEAALLRVRLVGRSSDEAFGVHQLVNGPLADALTHVGQIAAWRRFAGRPAPRADVFRGRPPKG